MSADARLARCASRARRCDTAAFAADSVAEQLSVIRLCAARDEKRNNKTESPLHYSFLLP
jgi:hypothetical protein